MNRRTFLKGMAVATAFGAGDAFSNPAVSVSPLGFQFAEVTNAAGIQFRHNSGAYGGKLLPETLGAGCAFLDYDADGWQDILLINSMDWPGHKRQASTLKLYRNNRNGTFSNVTRQAGLDIEIYGMGVAVGDYNNDGFPDILVTCVGQNRLFRNTGKGTFVDATHASGLGNRQGFSTSSIWFDFDRDGLLDLFVCNYVKWSPEHDVFCSWNGKQKSYCTPEAYHGETCWLFHNRGNGTFEEVTAPSGIFDASSKSLGVAMLDYDHDGWPDLLVANDTQPNKLYQNQRNGTFKDVAVEAGIAFSADGKARAGMGVDVGDFENSGNPGVAITNFDNEMIGLYRASGNGNYQDVAMQSGVGLASKTTLGFGCAFADVDLDGSLDLIAVNGHIDDTVRNVRNVGYAQSPQLFLNNGKGSFTEVGGLAGGGFNQPKVGRGLACGDFDRDGDCDILITTNNGPAYLFRNDNTSGNRSIRFHLIGTKSNRDAIGSIVRIFHGDSMQTRMVKGGSSYLSQSELPITFGLGKRDKIDRVVIEWPSGRTEEYKDLAAGRSYRCTESKGIASQSGFSCSTGRLHLTSQSKNLLHPQRNSPTESVIRAYNRQPAILSRQTNSPGHRMNHNSPNLPSRRNFLTTSGGLLAAAMAPKASSALTASAADDSTAKMPTEKSRRKIPIGVFDPVFGDLSLDAMLEKISGMGVEAVEIGTGGYPGSSHCPVQELLADPTKLRAWKKKFDDRNILVATLSCHGNPVHPDPKHAERDAQAFRNTVLLAEQLGVKVIVGFSGCPGGSPSDTMPNWVTYRWPPEFAQVEDWQWKEKVIPYWTQAAKFAREHGIHRLALEMHPNQVVYNPRTLMRLREAVGEEIGANNDLSHLFWQGCDPVGVIHFLGKQGAIFHAHMKDTVMFHDNVAKYGVLNFASDVKDLPEASETFRAVGYGHGANTWKDIVRAYMEVGYAGILSIENEDPILTGEVGVERALYVLKNVRNELLEKAS